MGVIMAGCGDGSEGVVSLSPKPCVPRFPSNEHWGGGHGAHPSAPFSALDPARNGGTERDRICSRFLSLRRLAPSALGPLEPHHAHSNRLDKHALQNRMARGGLCRDDGFAGMLRGIRSLLEGGGRGFGLTACGGRYRATVARFAVAFRRATCRRRGDATRACDGASGCGHPAGRQFLP